MRELQHVIELDATPATVWAVLTDTGAYPDWNPFVRRLEGELREGAKLQVEIAPPDGRPMTFKPSVLTARPDRELRWLGRFLVPGLLDGEHSFRIEPLPGGRSRFTQAERFTGILVRLVSKTLDRTQVGFEQMNDALKRRAEAAQTAPSVSS